MPSFSYRALGRDGKEVRGVLQAESETAAVTRIRDNYPVLLSISEQADKKNASSILQMEIGNKRVKPKALSVTTNARTIIWHQFCFLLFFKLLKVLLDTELGVS